MYEFRFITNLIFFVHTAGSDYESRTFTLVFTSTDEGTTTLCANVSIIDDQLGNEPVEAFSVSFVSFSPAGQEGLNTETCVFIEDNDSMYNITYNTCRQAVFHIIIERVGQTASIIRDCALHYHPQLHQISYPVTPTG